MKISKIIKKSIKYIFLIILGVILGLNLNSRNNNAALLHASAEEASTVAETVPERGLDLTQYPSANLIPYPYKDTTKTSGGVTYTDNGDGSITLIGSISVDGSSTNTSEFTLVFSPAFLSVGTYTYKVYGLLEGMAAYIQFFDGSTWVKDLAVDRGNGVTFSINQADLVYSLKIIVFISSGFAFDNVTVYPMLNVGDFAYPYIPSLDGFYHYGYNEGYGAGETDGYDQGKTDGLDYARAGYWNDSQIFVDLKGMSNGVSVSDYLYISPIVTSNGIDLSNVYTEIVTKYPNLVLTECYFDLQFINSRQPYLDYFKVRYVGDLSLVVGKTFTARIVDTVTWKVPPVKASFSAVAGSNYVADFIIDTSSIGSVAGYEFVKVEGIPIQNISQFKDLRFYSVDTVGNTAYRAGYQAGLNDDNAYQEGYYKGYTVGKSDGFQEGFNQTKSGGFGWLITSVQQFLDVKFFGDFGIGTLIYVGLGITLVSIFLRVFAGG